MKKTFLSTIVILIVGCGDTVEAKTPQITGKNQVVIVPNTEHIDYQSYRQEWRRVNNKPAPTWAPDFTIKTRTHKDPENEHETVVLHLDNLSFKDAFRVEFLGKGEGHTFWWRGSEYTTNLLDVVRNPSSFLLTDPFIEKVVKGNVTTERLEEVRNGLK